MPSNKFSSLSASLTQPQVEQLVEDLNRGENLGFIDPASSTLKSQNAADYFYNTADGNALYRATAAGQAVTAFTKFVTDTGGTVIGESATFAGLPAVINGKYSLLTADVVGTGTALNPQYRRGVYKAIAGVWTPELPSGGESVSSETVVLAALPADTWTNVPTGTAVTAPVYIDIKDSSGQYIELLKREQTGHVWQVLSSTALANVQIILWA